VIEEEEDNYPDENMSGLGSRSVNKAHIQSGPKINSGANSNNM